MSTRRTQSHANIMLMKNYFNGPVQPRLSSFSCERRGPVTLTCFGINTSRPRQNGRHFAEDIFKCIFLNENVWIPIKISLGFVPKGPINNIPALVQIMAWRRPGDKPLSDSMMVSSPAHICVTRPKWVNTVLTGLSTFRRKGCTSTIRQ